MENNPCQQCLGREVNKPVQREFNTGSFREFRIFVSGFGKQHPVSYIDIIRQSRRFLSGLFLYVRNKIVLHLLHRDQPPLISALSIFYLKTISKPTFVMDILWIIGVIFHFFAQVPDVTAHEADFGGVLRSPDLPRQFFTGKHFPFAAH